jgi:glycosyltransferase involved in cell wall biosynthesis
VADSEYRARRITYVTDLARTLSGGGSYVVNWHAFDELANRFDAQYAGPIVPSASFLERNVSRFRRRVLKMPGRYAYFSGATLDRTAQIAESQISPASEAVVFRSAGRWCRCRPTVPYFVYLDAVVHTFFFNTFDVRDFEIEDLERIWKEEAAFLENASGVFFESEWGMRMAITAYNLERDHYRVAGRGGSVNPPASDSWDGVTHRLVTMAMDFRQKGGDIVAEAYAILKPRFPSLSWTIVGGPPDDRIRRLEGVTYEGVLRPSDPDDRARLESILAGAFLLVHPTREDTSPLVITEAAYFGCPAISVNVFAIPELLLHERTGILLETPVDPATLASAIESLLVSDVRYMSMRREARAYALANFQWSNTGAVIANGIDGVIGG